MLKNNQLTQSFGQQKTFILMCALLQGIGLLLMHNWVVRLGDAPSYYQITWPLYAIIITLPLSLMLLAEQPRQTALNLSLAFSVVAALCAAYMGNAVYAKGLSNYLLNYLYMPLGLCIFVAWFICLAFFEHYCQYKQWFTKYEALFDFSWRNLVKILTASVFVGLFWAALFLLAGLFKILGIRFFDEIIQNRHFAYPASTVAFGLGLSLYTARQEALSEFKRATLQVLGWLLPLVSVILIGFIITLPLKGLSLLWKTGYATALMLSLLGLMVFLVNAAFQDGVLSRDSAARYPAWMLKLANIGLISMPVYALLCTYGVYLRVHQYGWTSDRVWAAGFVLIMTLYAFGYAFAAAKSFKAGAWLQNLKMVNIVAAFCVVLLLVLFNSPLLNPTRIGVQSQVARLLSGEIKSEQFDYKYLRFRGGKYGNEALKNMLTNPRFAEEVKAALSAENESYYNKPKRKIDTTAALQANIVVYPKGTVLDASFYNKLLADVIASNIYIECLSNMNLTSQPCYALSVDLNHDNKPEVMIFSAYNAKLYTQNADGWHFESEMRVIDDGDYTEHDDKAMLEQGNFKVISQAWDMLQLGQRQFAFEKR